MKQYCRYCANCSVVLMILSLHFNMLSIKRCEKVEEHLAEVQRQSERLQREMITQQEIFAGIVRDMKGEW